MSKFGVITVLALFQDHHTIFCWSQCNASAKQQWNEVESLFFVEERFFSDLCIQQVLWFVMLWLADCIESNHQWLVSFGRLRCVRSSVIGRTMTVGWRSWCTSYRISWIRTGCRPSTHTTACCILWVIPSARASLHAMLHSALRRYSYMTNVLVFQSVHVHLGLCSKYITFKPSGDGL